MYNKETFKFFETSNVSFNELTKLSFENNLGGNCHRNQDLNLTNEIEYNSEKDFVVQAQNNSFAFISTIEPKCFEEAISDEN